jgi:uncharacterized protein YdeI (YjbR/CyaY-like superfamily)
LKKVFFIYYNKRGSVKPSVSYEEAVEEALSFGWIDSKVNSLDGGSGLCRSLLPESRAAQWSKLNKQRVDMLIKAGLMTQAGLDKAEAAKRDGSCNMLDAVENQQVQADLIEALAAENKKPYP